MSYHFGQCHHIVLEMEAAVTEDPDWQLIILTYTRQVTIFITFFHAPLHGIHITLLFLKICLSVRTSVCPEIFDVELLIHLLESLLQTSTDKQLICVDGSKGRSFCSACF